MKDIALILEQSAQHTGKKLLAIYGIEVVLLISLIAVKAINILYSACFLIILLLLFRFHQQRVKQMVEEGALTRILLLPLKRRAYMWSEILFTTTTICVLILLMYVVWILVNTLFSSQLNLQTILLQTRQITIFSLLFPQNLFHMAVIIIYVVMISLLLLTLVIGLALKDNRTSSLGGCLNFVFLVLIQRSYTTSALVVLSIGGCILIAIILRHLNKVAGFQREKAHL